MAKPLAFVIEDSRTIAAIFAQAVQAAGYEVQIIQDGEQAMRRLRVARPDVVVLDVHLPSISGPAILHMIRADHRLTNTMVIVATGDARMAEELRDRADLVLLKPVDVNQLRDLAARLRLAHVV